MDAKRTSKNTYLIQPENAKWVRRVAAYRMVRTGEEVSASEIVDEILTKAREQEAMERQLKKAILHPAKEAV